MPLERGAGRTQFEERTPPSGGGSSAAQRAAARRRREGAARAAAARTKPKARPKTTPTQPKPPSEKEKDKDRDARKLAAQLQRDAARERLLEQQQRLEETRLLREQTRSSRQRQAETGRLQGQADYFAQPPPLEITRSPVQAPVPTPTSIIPPQAMMGPTPPIGVTRRAPSFGPQTGPAAPYIPMRPGPGLEEELTTPQQAEAARLSKAAEMYQTPGGMPPGTPGREPPAPPWAGGGPVPLPILLKTGSNYTGNFPMVSWTMPGETIPPEGQTLTETAGDVGIHIPWESLGPFKSNEEGRDWARDYREKTGKWPWDGPGTMEENLAKALIDYFGEEAAAGLTPPPPVMEDFAPYSGEGDYYMAGGGGWGGFGGGWPGYGGGGGYEQNAGAAFPPWWQYPEIGRGI